MTSMTPSASGMRGWRSPASNNETITRETLLDLMRAALPPKQSGEQQKGLPAWVDNALYRADRERPHDRSSLSGPKVNSFYANLIGHWHEVTNDSWMAAFAGLSRDVFGGTKKTATRPSGKKAIYYAYSAKVRQATQILTAQMTGDRAGRRTKCKRPCWSWTWTLGDLMRDRPS